MATVTFDTLALARKLEAAGFPSRQAQDTAAALAETFGPDMLTRRDLGEVTNALRTEMSELAVSLRAEMSELAVSLRAEMRELEVHLRAEMRELEARLRSEIAGLGAELRSEIAGLGAELRSKSLTSAATFASSKPAFGRRSRNRSIG